MKRYLLPAAALVAIGCGARGGGPLPPLRPEPPPLAELTVSQRGSQAVLRFEPVPPVIDIDGVAVPLDRIELLVRSERYPVFLPEALAAALESERRERMALAREAAERAERTLARQRGEQEQALGEEAIEPEEPEEPAADEEELGPSPEELLLRRIPFDARERWREESIRGAVLLEAAERFERALDALWTELELPGAIVDIRQPPELPDPTEIIAAAERVARRLGYEGRQPAPEFLQEAVVVASVPAGELNEYVVDGMVQFVHAAAPSTEAEIRTRYYFAVRSVSEQGMEGRISRVASLAPSAVPAAPRALTTELTEEGVELRWEPPLADVTGAAVDPESVGYNVYRRRASVDVFPDEALNDEPLRELEFLDEETAWNTASVYEVRALRVEPEEEEEIDRSRGIPLGPRGAPGSSDGPLKESGGAPTDEIVATDFFPPGPPSRIEAVRAGGTVTVRWRESRADDLDGYRVYRHRAPMPELPGWEPPEPELPEGIEGEPAEESAETAEAGETTAEEGATEEEAAAAGEQGAEETAGETGEAAAAAETGAQEDGDEEEPARRIRRNLLVAAGWELLTGVPVDDERFIDPASDPGATWFYVVEAVDESGNVSRPIVIEVAGREPEEQR